LALDDGYVVVVQHPVTTEYEQAFAQVTETLHAVDALGTSAVWFWPNVDAGSDATSKAIRVYREQLRPERMHFFRNMPPEEFLRLLIGAKALIGNSSVAIREGSFLGIPSVDIGDRQRGRQHGANVAHASYDRREIADAAREQIEHGRYTSEHIYGDGQSGARVARVLAEARLTIEKRLCY
jgi:UDP-N-acetylglucosamine 2-epimerase